ncbi:FAD-dependent oxidoreductase [Thalassoroseus pseudoceratinae]|uniref:FAD-dependent oxidoreductase n=1 Tax=Thalassoroseus pseudoceratinae TaxID=2713176 RepID=UPI001982439C|nr:FAD-dependent oxidoreductase [Thalassoroseus pseudoceratinae]
MMKLSAQSLIFAILIACVPTSLRAQKPELPEPAVPGLRYYYPPEKIEPRVIETDVCIYGGTCAGVVAAVQADRMGQDAVLLEFGKHLGGLSSGGLSHTDGGDPGVCGGIAREFYKQIGQRNFRPSEAEAAFEKLLEPTNVVVHKRAHLDEVKKDGSRIVSIKMEDGLEVRAKQFIDATYEGDLLARAGVSWHAGREANSVYNETYNGIRKPGTGGHNWPTRVDPFRVAGDPTSGLLPRVNYDPGQPGDGDDRIQAFCFRMWLTKKDPRPFPKPAVYEPEQYELLARLFESGANPSIGWSLDTNNHHLFKGAYFIDFVGGNYDWPDANWLEREQIFQDHANYQIGVMWFLANSPRVPEKYRKEFQKWGLPKNLYQDTSGWTHQLYIREGRRMVSDYVMTQHNCQGREVPEDSVGLASYNMDSHHCQMTVVDGAVRNEGNVEIPVEPYPISYRALTPKRSECTNLLVPVALSSSHIAFGSIRMEPVFMLLGQSAATAASHAIESNVDVQDVDYAKLRDRLLEDGQILNYTGPPRRRGGGGIGIDPKTLKGIVVDNDQAEMIGPWQSNNVTHPRVGPSYVHDNNEAKGECVAKYTLKLPKPGRYEVRVSWPSNPNRATNVPIKVDFDGASKTVLVNQKKTGEDGFNSIGKFEFDRTAVVEISNRDTNGYVIADAVQFLPVKENAPDENLKEEEKQDEDEPPTNLSSSDAPNILLLFADDFGYEALGCYGGKDFQTPNLDRLATQGMRFTRAYTSPVCTPSRMSLYTGNYVSHHGYFNVLPVHQGTKKAVDFRSKWATYPQLLRDAGYRTSVTGKWQLAALEYHPEHCRDAGFDSWCVWQIWRDGSKTTRYWNPCFNHDGQIRDDISQRFGPDVLADYVIEQMRTAAEAKRPFYIHHNMLLPHWPIIETPDDKIAAKSASLAGMIAYMDGICGRILDEVDRLGISENTVVIFMGDNGTDSKSPRSTTDGSVKGGKFDLNDAGTHIPLIVRHPGTIEAGQTADELIDMTDLFPTICEIAGVEIPHDLQLDGVSFQSRLQGGKPSSRPWVTGGIRGHVSVFDGSWRVGSNTKQIIDARQLPRENIVKDVPSEFVSTIERLQAVPAKIAEAN